MVERHPRWGFWKCFRAMRRLGYTWNHKCVYRIYCELRLNQKRRAKKRLPKRERQPLLEPQHPNQVWSADFMSDALHVGNRFRTFNVIDDFNRECLAVEIDTSLTGKRLIRVFERLRSERGLPGVLRVDNGPEFLSSDFVAWAESAGMFILLTWSSKNGQSFKPLFSADMFSRIQLGYDTPDMNDVVCCCKTFPDNQRYRSLLLPWCYR